MAFLVIANGSKGRELYSTDGTSEGTVLIEINKSVFDNGRISFELESDPLGGGFLGELFVFAADDGTETADAVKTGRELFISDGTPAGTRLLLDINPLGGSDPDNFFATPDGTAFFFTAFTPDAGREIWITDGTAEGTRQLTDLSSGSESGIEEGFQFTNQIGDLTFFFTQNQDVGAVLSTLDLSGQVETVRELIPGFDPGPSTSSAIVSFVTGETIEFREELVFLAEPVPDPDDVSTPDPTLFITDGTAAGTRQIIEFDFSVARPRSLTVIEDQLYFVVNAVGGTQIWTSDGTSEGTRPFSNVQSSIQDLTVFDGFFYFNGRATDGDEVGFELYRASIETGEIELFADLDVGGNSGTIKDLTVINGRLYFSANTTDALREPWVTDGTPEGTMMLANISATGGSADANDGGYFFTRIDDLVYFGASSNEEGRELWVTDSTPEGTRLAVSFREGPLSSSPIAFPTDAQSTPPDPIEPPTPVDPKAPVDPVDPVDPIDPQTPTRPTSFDDILLGTASNDTIKALAGNDNVNGLAGDDLLIGGGGNDNIKGLAGDDRLRGNGGDDTLKGGGGDDNIKGGSGDDNIKGNGGSDVIKAGGGADTVKGGGGADVINGGGGSDLLQGGGGNDTITGKGGDDTLKGNGGADVFQFRTSDRNETVLDFRQSKDKIEIQNGANSFAALDIEQDGRDVLIGFGAGQVRVVTDSVDAFDESDFIF